MSKLDQIKRQAEIDAYRRGIAGFDSVAHPGKRIKASRSITSFKSGQESAASAIRQRLIEEEIAASEIVKAALRGEREAYAKMIAGVSGSHKTGFLNNDPSSLYAANRMLGASTETAKGQFIAQNWNTIRDGLERSMRAGKNLSWRGFRGLATQVAVFLEEYQNDIRNNALDAVDGLLTAIWEDWPTYYELSGGQRIRYDQNQGPLPSDLSGDALGPLQELAGVSNYIPDTSRKGGKVESLLDAYMKFPDNPDAYVYAYVWSGNDSNQAFKENIIDDELSKRVFSRINEIYKLIASNNVEDEVYRKQALYNSIMELRKALDSLSDVIDPTNNKPIDENDISRIMGVKKLVDTIKENAKDSSELYRLLEKISEEIQPATWFYNPDMGFLEEFGSRWQSMLRRASGDWMKEEKRIVAALRKIDKYYDQIWAMIHVGQSIPQLRQM